MNTRSLRASSTLFVVATLGASLAAQAPVPLTDAPFPLEKGELVTTFSPNGPDDDGNCVILVDPRDATTVGANWNAPFFSNENAQDPADVWNHGNLGSVFGIAIDAKPDIFVTASSSYDDFGVTNTYGPAGGGGVYKIDGVTGKIYDWMVTGTGGVGTNELPNPAPPGVTPPGLGDICYDADNDQYFVSNFADGCIYQVKAGSGSLSNQGIVQAVYDPFLQYPYAGNPTFAPLGERVWAVHVMSYRLPMRPGVVRRTLLFSVWLRDEVRFDTPWPSSWPLVLNPPNNAIFQWDLNAAGDPVASGPVLWRVLPYEHLRDRSNPVSDIASHGPFVFVAERTMVRNYGQLGVAGHEARVLFFQMETKYRFTTAATTWPPQPDPITLTYRVGDYNTVGANCAGGVTEFLRGAPFPLANRVWATGDALRGDVAGNRVYGLQGMPLLGNQFVSPYTSTSVLIDLDHDISVADKSQPGDVERVQIDAD